MKVIAKKSTTTRFVTSVSAGMIVLPALLMLVAACGSSNKKSTTKGKQPSTKAAKATGPAEKKLSEEDKAALARYTKIYDVVSAAAKNEELSVEEYLVALATAAQCQSPSASQAALVAKTSDGPLKIADIVSRCEEMADDIQKRGSAEEGCGYASFVVIGGKQAAGTKKWSTDVTWTKRAGSGNASRQIVQCDKVPAKSNKMPALWKGKLAKAAEEACGKGAVIIYQSKEWDIREVEDPDGTEYSERALLGQCWYRKGPVGEGFAIPSACGLSGEPEGGDMSCVNDESSLVFSSM